MKYILINIGCIECGVSSNIVGIFKCKEYVDLLAEELQEKADWRKGGENHYVVFQLPDEEIISDEYMEYLK